MACWFTFYFSLPIAFAATADRQYHFTIRSPRTPEFPLMAGLFSDDLKRRVLDASNIVDIIQSAVGKLIRAGRSLKCCCPFHHEKTPSFNINAEGQYFKCFGCGVGGDVFKFVMLHERVDFPEALKILADRAGIRVETDPHAQQRFKQETDWKSYLYKINDVAARFYREQLFSDAGKVAREYLKKRGLSDETCEQFRIGYAPGGGSPLLARLSSQGAPAKAALAAGLASQRDEGGPVRDFFYDRLMFPIADIQGRIIAFGGRILGDGEPKYLNTRETPLFSKQRTVYAINFAKDPIIEKDQAIIVEGYTDVMMCHQFGITNVIACLGTAITADHIRQLRRVAGKLLLLTDSDAAGERASERSLTIIFQEQMPARVSRLTGGDKDPCEFLLSKGREHFEKELQNSLDLFDYKFEMVRKKHDLLQPLGVKNAAEELMALISSIPDPILKNGYRYEVLKRLNIDERSLRYETVANRAETLPNAGDGGAPEAENEVAKLERQLLGFLFHEPAWVETAMAQVDLGSLTGKLESILGRAIVEAVADGVLPPDAASLNGGAAGSVVARELLRRIPDTLATDPNNSNNADDGRDNAGDQAGDSVLENTRSLCISLAEEAPHGVKLDAGARLQFVVARIREKTLYARHDEIKRRVAQARMGNDAAQIEQLEQEARDIRKAIADTKSSSNRGLQGSTR